MCLFRINTGGRANRTCTREKWENGKIPSDYKLTEHQSYNEI